MHALRVLLRKNLVGAWRHRWPAVLFTWLICAVGWAFTFSIPNQYEASARLYVDADAVLTPLLRAAVDTADRAADAIDIEVADDRCSSIHLALVCRYGLDLNAEGRDARAAVAAVVREVLGVDPAFDPERDITVEVVDVVDGDPHSQ